MGLTVGKKLSYDEVKILNQQNYNMKQIFSKFYFMGSICSQNQRLIFCGNFEYFSLQ